ncbi:MAG: alpha/beta hydrolase [Burkholderiales bacterium]
MKIASLLLSLVATGAFACGEVVTLQTHDGTTTRYAFSAPQNPKGTLILLAGGGGHLDLDAQGCARKLKGNSLVRSQALFHAQGFATALVDAPSDYHGMDGLGAFRAQPAHAEDLGKVAADLRTRVKGPVWVVGTSRGAISAANAASRLKEVDGVVLTSPVTVGTARGRKAWTAQTVLDNPLGDIRVPLLVVSHAQDGCFRSPPSGAQGILDRYKGPRAQAAVVSGGTSGAGDACEGRSPHGFLGLEAELAAGIARFAGGGQY